MPSILHDFFRHAAFSYERGWRHPAPGYCAMHTHPAFEIVYHVAGKGRTRDSFGTVIDFEEGGIVVYRPGIAHEQTMAEPGEDVCIHVGCDLPPPPELATSVYVPPFPEPWRRAELEWLTANQPALTPAQRLAYNHRAAALLIELIGAGRDEEVASGTLADHYASQAHDYILGNFRSLQNLAEVASRIGIGYDHLRHCFRKRYGFSLKQWHLTVRIDRAKDLLRNTNLPLKVVADLCGFANARYFSTSFRSLTGTTPAAYRQSG
jgi:AraC-like DNA-binding protein